MTSDKKQEVFTSKRPGQSRSFILGCHAGARLKRPSDLDIYKRADRPFGGQQNVQLLTRLARSSPPGDSNSMAVKPRTIIFVPGAWHTTKSYDIVIKKLEQAGYPGELVRVELPSVGPQPGDPVMYSIRPDVQAVEKAIAEQVDKGTPVLLVAHSYGSVVASCALKDFANSGLVNWLIVAGFLLEFGQSLLDLCGGVPPPLWNKQVQQTIFLRLDQDANNAQGRLFTAKRSRTGILQRLTCRHAENSSGTIATSILCVSCSYFPHPVFRNRD